MVEIHVPDKCESIPFIFLHSLALGFELEAVVKDMVTKLDVSFPHQRVANLLKNWEDCGCLIFTQNLAFQLLNTCMMLFIHTEAGKLMMLNVKYLQEESAISKAILEHPMISISHPSTMPESRDSEGASTSKS